MNEQLKELALQAGFHVTNDKIYTPLSREEITKYQEKFAELIVKKVLDEVADRAFVCGDRAWSDDLDRQWVELVFDLGPLSEIKK